jgi:CDP-glucose 4,6-dehydratase
LANILVTGTTGFAGGNMAKLLIGKHENNVIGIRHDNSPVDTPRLLGIDDKITWTYGDILEANFVKRVVNDYEVDEIYHFAALPIVRIAGRSPVPVFQTNIAGTWNVLEAARDRGIEEIRVVHCSTDKAYGDTIQKKPYRETQGVGVSEIYGTSKAAADLIAQSYALNYGMKVAVARPCNMFGPADMNPRIVPNTIRLCLQGKKPLIFKGIDYVREYIYVENALEGLYKIMQGLRTGRVKGEVFNVGSGEALDQLQVIKKILRHFPCIQPVMKDPSEYMKREIRYQKLDSSKMRKWFKWRPKYDFEAGLKTTIAWWKERPELYSKTITFTR